MGGGGGGGAVRFRPIQPVGGGGGAVRFRPIQPVGGEGGVLSAFGRFNQGGGGGGGADVSFRPIQSMRCPRSRQIQPVDGGCCPLSANSASGGAHVVNRGGGGAPFSPEGGGHGPPWGCPCLSPFGTRITRRVN